MKYLRTITTLPYCTPTGRIVTRPGYDAETGIYLHVAHDYAPNISQRIGPNDIRTAMRTALATLTKPWSLFRFADSASVGALFSMILAAVARPAMDRCPAYAADAGVVGAGKTFLVTAAGAVIEGHMPSVLPYTRDGAEDELSKLFISSLLDNKRFLCIDNVDTHVKSAVLAGVLTSGRITGRVLGQSRTVDGELQALLTLTGVNLSINPDLQRRIVRLRLTTGASPTTAQFAFHPVTAALSQRLAIAEAALTIWSAYFSAGAPIIIPGDAGGWADWNRLCRQPVLWLAREGYTSDLPWPEVGDPAASMLANASALDPETQSLSDLLQAVEDLTQGEPFQAPEAVTWYTRGDSTIGGPEREFRLALRDLAPHLREPSNRSIGSILRSKRDRPAGGLKIIAGVEDRAGAWWRVVPA